MNTAEKRVEPHSNAVDTEVRFLREYIARLEASREADWLGKLEQRKLDELAFHNKSRATYEQRETLPQDVYEQLHGNKKFYATTKLSNDYLTNWVRTHSAGRIVLDYACGNGGVTRKAAQAGAALAMGMDISDVSVANARRLAAEEGLGNAVFFQGDCEKTGLPDNSVDVILCSGMLHHLDLSYAFPEMRRILKPGGVCIAGEALDYNPAIKLYRMRTPHMRTEWEKAHILSYKDLNFASRFFEVREVRHWHLFSILGVKAPSLLPVLNALDAQMLRLPGIKLMSWIFTFELRKPV
ncbi:MAG: class I SAM-dependent methyltransferase [Deltaproteobacteria bacterium]|nr:class I SAM-dependent methyltransferase [Deltaproteobacteria bacterium]